MIAGFERLIVDLDWEIKPMLFGYYNAIFQGSEALARQFIVQRKVVLELFSSNSSQPHIKQLTVVTNEMAPQSYCVKCKRHRKSDQKCNICINCGQYHKPPCRHAC